MSVIGGIFSGGFVSYSSSSLESSSVTVVNESKGAVRIRFIATYPNVVKNHATPMNVGIAIVQYLRHDYCCYKLHTCLGNMQYQVDEER